MSEGKRGKPKRPGTVIKVRVSDYIKNSYLPQLQAKRNIDRQAAAGMALEAAAAAGLLMTKEATA